MKESRREVRETLLVSKCEAADFIFTRFDCLVWSFNWASGFFRVLYYGLLCFYAFLLCCECGLAGYQ